jgi:phosphatidylinositol-3,4,5-trisphosphate 3-phosphatase/dual-specificity protein phosphatase PTEN
MVRPQLMPSERRWVRYVHLLFTNQAPASYLSTRESRVRLVSITMYLTPPSGWKKPITSLIVGSDAGRGKARASVARYDDAYVKELEGKGSGGVTWGGVAGEGVYDSHKMFKSCGKMVASDVPEKSQEEVSLCLSFLAS